MCGGGVVVVWCAYRNCTEATLRSAEETPENKNNIRIKNNNKEQKKQRDGIVGGILVVVFYCTGW